MDQEPDPRAGLHEIDDPDTLAEAVDRLSARARARIALISPDLEPRVYDREPFVAALERFCLDHRNARVCVMVGEPHTAVRHSRRLIPLARRLTSSFELRRLGRADARSPRSLLVIDDRHAVYRSQAGRPDGVVIEDAPGQVKPYVEAIDAAYAASEPDTELRGLAL